ncbi:hypothetical protein RWH43_16815 [Microbacterium sp. KSW2-21]|uniref:Uncharacterized protein n=1 Tax=Microbacterium algihabitans TaxID=3075992 RepID=A0ABU3RZW1_9MICO|nr:hypothetical protein [Microbacterium sp. KSW2-21]MDU0328423.1 hypothetical protein [Microbacterium sp. KSW2-21]
MSDVTCTVPAMTDNELKASDYIYSGIKSLGGWGRTIESAHGRGGQRARHVGVLISDVILAGGEDTMPVAITGKLDQAGTGHLAVLYADVIVIAHATNLVSGEASALVTVHSLRELSKVEVRSNHNYYDGTDRRQQHADPRVSVTLERLVLTFADRGHDRTPLTDATAVSAALDAIRASLAR